MKKILFILSAALLALGMSMQAQAQTLRYVDATTLNIIGQAEPTGKPYDRINTQQHRMPENCIGFCGFSTGLAVVFSTDSHVISARWTTSQSMPGVNMTAITQKGLDLYIRDGEEWVYAGVARPTITAEKRDKHEYTIINNAPDGKKECVLYLPIWDRVESLEIGVEEGSTIAAMENPFRHKIIVHGSSITHGASSSRSGMTYPALMERRTGLYMINLGYSGMSTLQEEFAHYLAQVEDADAFVFDTFSNPSAEVIEERFDKFVDIIREKHPTTPLIFTQTIRRDTRNYNLKTEDFESRKQALAEKKVRERMQRDENIYFLDSEGWVGYDHLGTADGTHPTDLGFMRMVEHMEPQIVNILKKYGIK